MMRTREIKIIDWNDISYLPKEQRAKIQDDPGNMVIMTSPILDPDEPPLSPHLSATVSRALHLGRMKRVSFD